MKMERTMETKKSSKYKIKGEETEVTIFTVSPSGLATCLPYDDPFSGDIYTVPLDNLEKIEDEE
jgi:hypothetical protein